MQERLLRIYDVVGCKQRGIKGRISISRSAWWKGVAERRFPQGHLLSRRTRVWTESSIDQLLSDLAAGGSK
jgi:predicted DNA-binding transcriptional regulator AlpA